VLINLSFIYLLPANPKARACITVIIHTPLAPRPKKVEGAVASKIIYMVQNFILRFLII